MAKNFVNEGEGVVYQNSGAGIINSGSVVVMDAIVGISLGDIPVGQSGTVRIIGVWKLPKDTATAMDVGKAVFWNTVDKKIVGTSGANAVLAGIVTSGVSAGATTVNVKINA